MRTLITFLFLIFALFVYSQRFYDGSGHQLARFDDNMIYNASGKHIGRIDAERIYDGSGHLIGRVDGNYYYDGFGHQIGRSDGLRRMQVIIYFYYFY